MAVPKKRTSTSKNHIRRNIWIKKRYLITKKSSFLSKFIYMENSKSFIKKQPNHKAFGFLIKKPIGMDINQFMFIQALRNIFALYYFVKNYHIIQYKNKIIQYKYTFIILQSRKLFVIYILKTFYNQTIQKDLYKYTFIILQSRKLFVISILQSRKLFVISILKTLENNNQIIFTNQNNITIDQNFNKMVTSEQIVINKKRKYLNMVIIMIIIKYYLKYYLIIMILTYLIKRTVKYIMDIYKMLKLNIKNYLDNHPNLRVMVLVLQDLFPILKLLFFIYGELYRKFKKLSDSLCNYIENYLKNFNKLNIKNYLDNHPNLKVMVLVLQDLLPILK